MQVVHVVVERGRGLAGVGAEAGQRCQPRGVESQVGTAGVGYKVMTDDTSEFLPKGSESAQALAYARDAFGVQKGTRTVTMLVKRDDGKALTAADRANPRVSKAYDPIALPRLRAIRLVVDAAARHNKPVTMCGELAGKPMEALALMSIGMTRLSMGPASIGPIKEMILNVELRPIQAAVAAALSDGADGVSIRQLLTEWVEKQNLPMG